MSFDRITASLAALGVAVVLSSTPIATGGALAATETGQFAVRGLGSRPCGDLTAALAGETSASVMDAAALWTAGYVSHVNRSTPGVFEALPIVDNAVVARLALNICGSNPDVMFEAVLAQVIASFSQAALFEESALVRIGPDGASTTLRSLVFRKVQERLIGDGLLPPGSADGLYGPQSRQALIAFQEARGLAASGVPDSATLITMFIAPVSADEDNTAEDNAAQ